MKNYLKLQAKKTLSLMLAVLMLMTCWVWIAPEKAQAGTADQGYYDVRIVAHVPDTADYGVSTHAWYVNGVSLTMDQYDLSKSGANLQIAHGNISSFPTSWSGTVRTNKGGDCGNTEGPARLTDIRLQVYNNVTDLWVTISGTADGSVGGLDTSESGGQEPKFTAKSDVGDLSGQAISGQPTVTSVGTMTAASLTVPGIGSGGTASTAKVTAPIYDQYGVRMLTTYPDSYYVTNAGGDKIGENSTADGAWATVENGSAYVTINENIQKNVLGGASATNKIYLTAAAGTATGSQEITLSYPQYTVTVYANGRTGETTNAVIKMNKNGDVSGTWSTSGCYGIDPDVYPTGDATKQGYTFKGFWTNQQPESGDGSINAFEADFATPVDTDTYNKYVSEGGTVSNGIVTLATGEKYCDGGTQWNPDNKSISSDKIYYGWWLSTVITVKFYNIDGSYIDTETYKYGQKGSQVEWPNPLEEYDAGAYEYKVFAEVWQDISGIKVSETDYVFGTDDKLELVLTPTYVTKDYKATYTVNFINPTTGANLTGSGDYDYRYILGSEIPSTVTIPTAMANAADYSYEFAGWTDQVPSNSKYHIIAEDNTTFAFNSDWVVREDVTYYPVFRSTVRKYVVQFNYIDTTGTKVSKVEHIAYGAGITTPDYVNSTYAADGMGYELQGWKYTTAASAQETLDKDATLVFDSSNVLIATNNRADGVDEQAIIFEAAYDSGTPMPYNVTFKYKDAEGNDAFITAQVYNKTYITQETVDSLNIPAQYDDGSALYTFANKWIVTEGTADKDEYTKDEFTSFSPTSHVTFEAVYDDGVPFYTVTYVDGYATESYRILQGTNIPEWTHKVVNDNNTPDDETDDFEEDKIYVPHDYESETGTYKFAGWFDEKQTDTTYEETNGKEYTTADTVTGDITLYSQFEFEPFKFTITFWNFDKSVQLAAGEFEYGQNIEAVTAVANKAAQYRAPDETYTYEFIGWDNVVPTVCGNHDITFVAQYKPSYIYYDANWYNSKDDMNNNADALATTHHTYNSKVYSPSVKTTAPSDAPAGKSYVFAGWCYEDADGVEQSYTRGMLITQGMNFYATYTLVTEAHTVTAVVDGVSTEYKVADGEKAEAVPTPGNTYVDETTHKNFAGWYTEETYTNAFDIDNTAITESITIYAKFDTENHSKTNKELISAPTYYVAGSEKIWCGCSRADTEETVEIAKLTDSIAPTGTIYLGSQGKWSSTDEVGASATDGDPVTLYANADTNLILTINDTGDVNTAYNPSGVGMGIKLIRGFISTGVYTQDNQTGAASETLTIFEDTTEELNNAANYVVKLGEYTGLVDGETYIAYYYVVDKANNVLNKNVRTAKFIYDITAPVFTVEGSSNASKLEAGTPTYCKTATVTGIEDGATVTVNGSVVTAEDGKYVINTAGNYIITVTDKAGNSTSKKIVVAAEHNNATTEVKSTCTVNGYKKVQCAVCDYISENNIYTAPGHEWSTSFVPATCEENGYNIKVCGTCGDEEKTEYVNGVDGELIQAALGHSYKKDTDNNIIYTVVTKETCKTDGKKIANCERCGSGTITETIPADAENGHVYGGIKTLKATCTEDGKYYQSCKYCFVIKDGDTIPATGHKETYKVVTTAATCGATGVETEKCKKCEAVIGTSEIPATGKHIVYEMSRVEPTTTTKGSITYGCKTCTWTKTEEIDTLELYTVTFVDEDGNTIAELKDQVVGTTVTADDVTEPAKESDETYTYSFAGWVDEANNAVKLPFDVSQDITLKATFSKATIIYTHKFMVPTKWTTTLGADTDSNIEFATIIGAYGDTDKKPVAVPTFTDADANTDAALKKLYTFEFLGWSTTGAVGDIVEDFTIAGDATFYAVFEAKAIKYKVTYYSGTDFVWQTEVEGGETVTFGGTAPTKAYNDEYHYTFTDGEWYTDATLKTKYEGEAITADTRLYAKFNEVAHTFVPEAEADRTPATCTDAEKIDEKCSCGATRIADGDPALGHDQYKRDENGDYVLDDSGNKVINESQETVDEVIYRVVKCSVCGAEISRDKTSVSVAFKNENGVRLDTQNLNLGSAIEYNGEVPTKAADKENTYTFIGWYVEGDETKTVVDLKTVTATKDIVYVAKYEAKARVYTVSYVSLDNKVLQTAQIAYGGEVPEYTGAVQTKAADDTYHYLTYVWSAEAGTIVESDLIIKPVFSGVKHTYDKEEVKDATCTEQGGLTKICSACGHSYVSKDIVPATGHEYKLSQRIDPNYAAGTDGKEVYICSKCGDSYTTVISGMKMEVKVTVKDTNGNPKEGVRVSLVYAGTATVVEGTTDQFTNANGVASFWVVPGKYQALIEGGEKVTGEIEATEDGKVTGNGDVQVEADKAEGCGCSCHRSNFWGTIFRFFHKIIKFFTGRINCCSDPDSRY